MGRGASASQPLSLSTPKPIPAVPFPVHASRAAELHALALEQRSLQLRTVHEAACVVGAKRTQREVADTTTSTTTAPGRLCKAQSRKKSATDKKSPFAACVTGAAKAQREARS